jgi:beta-glucosidase
MHEKGGWFADSVSDYFEEYTKVVVDALSGRVADWMTFNEGTSFIGAGYLIGMHAPFESAPAGSEEERDKAVRLTKNVLLAHGKAAKVIREKAVLPPRVSIATDSTLFIPDSESPEDIESARARTFGEI